MIHAMGYKFESIMFLCLHKILLFKKISYHAEDAFLLNYYNRRLGKKQISLALRPGGWGQNVLLCKQNRGFSSLQFKQPHIIGYISCARDPLSRWSGLEWIPRPWTSAQLLEEKTVSIDCKNVLENYIIFMEMSAECRLARWKIHHNTPGSMDSTSLKLEPLPLWGFCVQSGTH